MQPLVENSIKYGMETLKIVEIMIQSRKKNNRMFLTVRDNGPGITEEIEGVMHNGLGIANIVERLEKLYGSNQKFQMENIPGGGLQVKIDIPLEILIGKESADERH